LVFSPEGGICLPVCVSHRTLGHTTLQSPEGDTGVRRTTLLTRIGAPRPSKLPHPALIVSPIRALNPFKHPYRWFTPPAGICRPSGLRR
jgi:hypothetical protein